MMLVYKFLDIQTDARLHCFAPVTVDGVRALIDASNNKYSSLDLMPTWLLKSCSDLLAPAVVRIFNSSLQSGVLPSCYSEALIAPKLKKQLLPRDDPSSYRPISNLSTLSKLFERIGSVQPMDHLTSHDLLPRHQSAYSTQPRQLY